MGAGSCVVGCRRREGEGGGQGDERAVEGEAGDLEVVGGLAGGGGVAEGFEGGGAAAADVGRDAAVVEREGGHTLRDGDRLVERDGEGDGLAEAEGAGGGDGDGGDAGGRCRRRGRVSAPVAVGTLEASRGMEVEVLVSTETPPFKSAARMSGRPIAVDVGRGQRDRVQARGVGGGRAEGAGAVAEEHRHAAAVVGEDQVQLAVAVHIRRDDRKGRRVRLRR